MSDDQKYKHIFLGGGEMGELMRSHQWDKHPLGCPERWPQSLKATLKLLLNSAYPMFLWWTKELYMFHNDSYLPALGKKHPLALGASAKTTWSEIWEQIGDIVDDILSGGPPFYAENLLVFLERRGFMEETYWTFSYSAAYNDNGEVEGIFCACNEVTKTVMGERRMKTIKQISDSTMQIETVDQACLKASEALSQNPSDIPFSLIYLLEKDDDIARLYGSTGKITDQASPKTISMKAEDPQVWPLQEVYQSKGFQMVEGLDEGMFLDSSSKKESAVVFPMFKSGEDEILGFIISGLSDHIFYDEDYQGFYQLLASHIGSAIFSVQTREAMQKQQDYLREVLQQAPVAISILQGTDYVIDLANAEICKLWGKSAEEVLGKPLLQGIPEVRDQGIVEFLDKVYYTGEPYIANEHPVYLERKGKMEKLYFSFIYHPFRDIRGKITGVMVVASSVNDQVEAKQEIEAMNKELLAINADLDNFVYTASHDLKAPISNIEGLTKALVKLLPAQVVSTEKITKVLLHIQKSIERFKKTVNDLSEVTKLQRETTQDVGFINLVDIIHEVKLDLDYLIQESGAQIECYYEEAPAIRFSAKNLRSIIYNLLSNAIKYRSYKRDLHIRIHVKADQDHVVLSVADNGLGMDLTDERMIFSMFKRMHDHVEGSGVGLYIVKKIIENAGGKIMVESKIEKGSTFSVYFRR
jgi:PAS domain S-box-containing protein